MPHLYILSGLGADHRIYSKIDFALYEVTHIPWIIPIENETIEAYALRLTKDIVHPNPILIGLSFGGMMAVEIAKIIPTTKVILLSSVKTRNELPVYFRCLGNINFHKIVPTSFYKSYNPLSVWLFGAKSDEVKQLFKDIIIHSNPKYIRWAVDQVLKWKNEILLPNMYHLHGTKDFIFPISSISNALEIKGEGHFMVMENSKDIEFKIKNILEQK
jgi:pimeloyl-ACP methyl ester carboxylesterase